MRIMIKTLSITVSLCPLFLGFHVSAELEHYHTLETQYQKTVKVNERHLINLKDHTDHDKYGNNVITLNKRQIELAGISINTIQPKVMKTQVYAPGEIKTNGYNSYWVSPRVDSIVIRRHVSLGDHVKQGQPLVTLFSKTVVEAQATFRIDSAEWIRVKQLGKKAVGGKRYDAAKTHFDASFGRLLAFGLEASSINALINNEDNLLPLGQYTLNAPIDGAVLTDNFHQGQRMAAGESLMQLADENELWVEAYLPAATQLALPIESEAIVHVENEQYTAFVSQTAHTIDPITRTRIVRMRIDNSSHRLHAGLFVDVYFLLETDQPILAVPESALMRDKDDNWSIFIAEQPNKFVKKTVKLQRSFNGWHEIQGLEPGITLVTEGAFFIASEIAKNNFDPHNH